MPSLPSSVLIFKTNKKGMKGESSMENIYQKLAMTHLCSCAHVLSAGEEGKGSYLRLLRCAQWKEFRLTRKLALNVVSSSTPHQWPLAITSSHRTGD